MVTNVPIVKAVCISHQCEYIKGDHDTGTQLRQWSKLYILLWLLDSFSVSGFLEQGPPL